MTSRRPGSSGLTLIELMVAMTIMLMAVAATFAVMSAGAQMTRNGEAIAVSNDASRTALEYVATRARTAGMGAPGGVWVNAGGVPTLISPVYGTNSVSTINGAAGNFADDLWVITPDKNAFITNCASAGIGAAAPSQVVADALAGGIQVTCASIFPATATLLASNQTTAALLTGLTITNETLPNTPGVISFAGVGGLTDSAPPGRFMPGDMVYQAHALHFYLAQVATGQPWNGPVSPTDLPALYVSEVQLGPGAGQPLQDTAATNVQKIAEYIDNFQVAYYVDPGNTFDPSKYQVRNSYGPAFDPLNPLRGIRVSVVAHGDRSVNAYDGPGAMNPCFQYVGAALTQDQVLVEDSVCPTTYAQFYRRSIYSRRIELPNMSPVGL
jgi:prepilin-type N-terminal cleavage/methylation domain-containing protein